MSFTQKQVVADISVTPKTYGFTGNNFNSANTFFAANDSSIKTFNSLKN